MSKHRWLSASLVFFIIVVGIFFYFINKLSQPVNGQVQSQEQQSSSITSYYINLTPKLQSGHYVSFEYPKGLHLVSTALISAPSVADFTYYVKDIYSWSLGIDIIKTPSGQLVQSSSYTLRKNNPNTYSLSIVNINGQQVNIMTDTSFVGGFSKVAYLTHGNLIGIVSLIGNDASGIKPLQTTFTMILNSWHWL